jgi:glycosyltransferase Alg8
MKFSNLTAASYSGEGLRFPKTVRRCRGGAAWPSQLAMLAALVSAVLILGCIVGDVPFWMERRAEVLITLGGIAAWRWGWFVVQTCRALLYRYYAFPRHRRAAARAVAQNGPVPEVTILATTYHEKPWITGAVFESLLCELSTLQGLERRPRIIVVTGCDQDDRNIQDAFAKFCGEPRTPTSFVWPPELILLRGDEGKRLALALGLRQIASRQPREDGVVVFMDADTLLQPGSIQRVLPLFRLTPSVAAVTTNETGLVQGPAWFAEWISLRFGLRHRTMCSAALSGMPLCLTGRFSVLRASVVTDPGFRALVASDVIGHWLWGPFEMLSGDDKSTWYWLAAQGLRMLYVPDAMVTTVEVVEGSGVRRALANIRRWSGNSWRHNWRALKLGPRKLGLFAWWTLLDQRLTMWTVLLGPCGALLALGTGRYEVAAAYLLWVLGTRLGHATIAWRHGRRFSAYYIPLQILSDWAIALTKLWVLFHPAKQQWLNRGARTVDTPRGATRYALRAGLAHYLYAFSCAALLIVVGLLSGFLPFLREAPLFLNFTTRKVAPTERGTTPAPGNHVASFERDLPLARLERPAQDTPPAGFHSDGSTAVPIEREKVTSDPTTPLEP